MNDLAMGIILVTPWYSLIMCIIVLYFLHKLVHMKSKKVFIQPWKYLYAAVGVFTIHIIITLLKVYQVIGETTIPRWFNAVFEFIMIVLFIYMIFTQMEHVEKR